MAYPDTLDNFAPHRWPGHVIHADHVNELQLAVEAMQAEIGTNPSDSFHARARLNAHP